MTRYAFVLILSGAVPFVLSLWPPLGLYRHKKALIKTLALIVGIFSLWDIWAVLLGHWSFDAASVGPYRILGLPVEEVLFFVVIPFCCIFLWEALGFIGRRGL